MARPCPPPFPETLTDLDVVLISGGGDRAARANLQCARPARVMSIPSIAHRLARVASGEASAATSLYSPKTWDFAAGHCLILAAGGVIVDQNGNEPVYEDDASGTLPRLFAGSRAVALELSSRNWDLAFRSPRESATPIVRLAKGGGVRNPHLLARAQGALLGHLVGSAMGSLFSGPEAVAIRDPLSNASIETAALKRRVMAGQPGPSGELAIAVGRSLIDLASDRESLCRVYADWVASSPAELDRALESAVRGEPMAENLSAIALARVTPFAVWGHAADPLILATTVRIDAALTHPAPIVGDAAAVLALVMQALLQGSDPGAALADGHAFARRTGSAQEVIAAIVESYEPPAALRSARATPSVLTALQAALFHLTRSRSFEEGIQGALALGSHSDTLPALAGSRGGTLRPGGNTAAAPEPGALLPLDGRAGDASAPPDLLGHGRHGDGRGVADLALGGAAEDDGLVHATARGHFELRLDILAANSVHAIVEIRHHAGVVRKHPNPLTHLEGVAGLDRDHAVFLR